MNFKTNFKELVHCSVMITTTSPLSRGSVKLERLESQVDINEWTMPNMHGELIPPNREMSLDG